MQISIYKGDIMLRTLLILVLSVLSLSGFAQSNDESESRVTFYPLNIPYALFGKFQTSIEVGVNKVDDFLIGAHFFNQLMFEDGKGAGFETQYRANFNRDPHVQFRREGYWGPFLEYDKLKIDQFQNSFTRDDKTSVLNLGFLVGGRHSIGDLFVIDTFGGFGLAKLKDGYGRFVIPYYKAGVQFGLKF